MRQTSLDAITAAADLCGGSGTRGGGAAASGGDSAPDRSSIFNDVIEQLAAKEESLPMQTGLYTLPSIQFLESLLEDMDSKTGSSGQLPEPPLYLPLDAFDLPELDAKPLRPLGPSPFEAGGGQPAAQVFHISAAATMQQPVAQPAPHGFIPTSSSMPILPHGSGFQGGRAGAAGAGPAVGGWRLAGALLLLLRGPSRQMSCSRHDAPTPPPCAAPLQAPRSCPTAGQRGPPLPSPRGGRPLHTPTTTMRRRSCRCR